MRLAGRDPVARRDPGDPRLPRAPQPRATDGSGPPRPGRGRRVAWGHRSDRPSPSAELGTTGKPPTAAGLVLGRRPPGSRIDGAADRGSGQRDPLESPALRPCQPCPPRELSLRSLSDLDRPPWSSYPGRSGLEIGVGPAPPGVAAAAPGVEGAGEGPIEGSAGSRSGAARARRSTDSREIEVADRDRIRSRGDAAGARRPGWRLRRRRRPPPPGRPARGR